MVAKSDSNGWSEWENYVLKRLESNDESHKDIMKQLQTIHIDIAKLKVKSGVWGAIGGAMLAGPTLLINWFMTNK